MYWLLSSNGFWQYVVDQFLSQAPDAEVGEGNQSIAVGKLVLRTALSVLKDATNPDAVRFVNHVVLSVFYRCPQHGADSLRVSSTCFGLIVQSLGLKYAREHDKKLLGHNGITSWRQPGV